MPNLLWSPARLGRWVATVRSARLLPAGNAPTIPDPIAFSRASAAVLGLVLVLALGMHCLTLREGHIWGDDFALYLTHAANISKGMPYTETGFIYNAQFSTYSPRNYPPVYPLILSAVASVFGFDFVMMKLVGVFLFLGFIATCWFVFRPLLPFPLLVVVTTFLALHPFFAAFKENILSDIPFGLFVFLSLLAYESDRRREEAAGPRWYHGLLLGLMIFLAYGTRSVGIVLVPCLVLTEWLRCRWLSWPTLRALLVFGGLAGLQGLILHGDRTYLDQMKVNPVETAVAQFMPYCKNVLDLVATGLPRFVRHPFKIIVAVLALGGLIATVRDRVSILHVFALLYTAAILIWPYYLGSRALIPLLPLALYFAALGLHHLQGRLARPHRLGLAAALALALGFGQLGAYRQLDTSPIVQGATMPEAQDCFAFIRNSTRADDVFLFSRCRALTFYTGRKAATYAAVDDERLWSVLDDSRATHLVAAVGVPVFEEDETCLLPFVDRHPARFDLVYSNRHFRVFRIRPAAEAQLPEPAPRDHDWGKPTHERLRNSA